MGVSKMGMKSNSGHFSKTNGISKLKLNIQLLADLPKNNSQLKHIFRNADGHFIDTKLNRQILTSLTNDKKSYLGTDKHGVQWYAKNINGKQIWASVKNGIIQNGGLNEKPIKFIEGLGLKKKIIRKDS